MKQQKFLDSVDVKSPCSESWDEMFGNDEVRFCSHCAKNVHNLSAMTRAKAEELIKKSEGKLCVRYIKTPEGKLITSPPTLTRITRRATIAASILATSLTLSTMTYSQGEPIKPKDNSTQTQKDILKKDTEKHDFATISGTVKDGIDALVVKAKVSLRDTKTNKIFSTQTNDYGIYEFKNVEPSVYELTVESLGFKKSVYHDIKALQNINLTLDITLEISEIMGDIIIIEDFAGISGLIKDLNDGTIPNAKVILRNTKTGKTLITKSNSAGFYEFKEIESGNYEIKVESDGFKKLLMQDIELSADTKLERNLVLDVGSANIDVEVTTEIKVKKKKP